MKKPVSSGEKSQRDKFIDAAKAAECDDDPERFAERVKKVAKAPPPHQPMDKPKNPAK